MRLIPGRNPGSHEADSKQDRSFNFLGWGTGVLLVAFIAILFPTRQAFRYSMSVGDIARETIVAPFTFHIQRSSEELEGLRNAARRSIPPVLQLTEAVEIQQTVLLASLLDSLEVLLAEAASGSQIIAGFQQLAPELTEESLIYLYANEVAGRAEERRLTLSTQRLDSLRSATDRVVAHYFSIGIVDSKAPLRAISGDMVTVDTGEGEILQRLSVVVDMNQVFDSLANMLRNNLPLADMRLVTAGFELTRAVLRPNLIYDEERTERRREAAASEIPLFKGTVLADEKIIDEHTRVDEEVIDKLASLNTALAEREYDRSLWPVVRTWLARILIIILVLGVYVAWLREHRETLLQNNRKLITLAIVIAIELALVYLLRESSVLSVYLAPVAVATMLLTILFDTGIGLVTAFVIGFLLGSVLGFDFQSALVHTLAGATGVFTVSHVRKRSHFYRALWVVPLVYLISILGVELLRFNSAEILYTSMLYGAANGALSVVITMGLLPIFESLFNFSTNISLLELSDLNHPLLRQLAMRAPGTYQHSLMMAEMSAAAAEACGANELLTRIGAYFHDIGKMNKPEYYVENQQDRNPHEKLAPNMSSLIVSTHVKEGIELAEEYRLPEAIKAFIPEHHGTMSMTYFFLKAVEDAKEGEKVSEDDFRYDGPKPQSIETGIVMLADSVEAASRVLQEPSPRRFRMMVRELVERRFEDGELDECPITLRDLRLVQESFVSVLSSRFHQRIDYPDRGEVMKKAAEKESESRQKSDHE
ncbi:HD family phosphohydrolase [Gemmatimonadota bacterium]